ncbi:MAG: Tol-Pal system beta propeller repeat protein TolB [Alphaproteobacteria bacterium]|nr:Tol-Pal system beta propeller repeat protein TolB [Alphaproteobacteria bacterium]
MRKITLVTLCLIITLCATTCHALKIEITKGEVRPDPIAITDFHAEDSSLQSEGKSIADVVGSDLEGSGLFALLSKVSYIQKDESVIKDGPRFADWRVISARFLVAGSIKSDGGNKITIEFRLYDVIKGEKLLALAVSGEQSKWRKIAHKVADEIYTRVTNEAGYFCTQIAFAKLLNPKSKERRKQIMRVDQDGDGMESLTDGKYLVLTPRYSADGKKIVYLAYVDGKAHVYMLDLASRHSTLVNDFGQMGFGMSFAPRFSADSTEVVMSLVKKGSSAIYAQNLQTKKLTRLTDHVSIDTSPCFSPDGQQIVFTSDRGGKEQLYVMNHQGQNVRRISYGDGKYSQPVWSPRGDWIAFTKQVAGQFYIGVIKPDGTDERLIAQGYLVEGADWAPNGRYLIFTKEQGAGRSQVYMMDLTGRHQRAITPPDTHASDCSWSPSIK